MYFRFLLIVLIFIFVLPISAQDSPFTPQITVQDQHVSGNTVVIQELESQRFGMIAIRADDGTGNLGGLIGFSLIRPGVNRNVRVQVEMLNITPRLYAVLHRDTDPFGEFQYESVEGADLPVEVDGEIVMQAFDVSVISAHDQFVDPDNFNRIVVDTAAFSLTDDAWLAAHSDDNGLLGDILGHTFLEQGTSRQVPLLLRGDVTDTVHITLHPDTGAPELFEYSATSEADLPLELDEQLVMTTISTVPTLRVNDQLVVGSDLTRNAEEQVPFVIDSVLSEGAGWLVVTNATDSGERDDVIGVAPVQNGYNDNVIVQVTQAEITPTLFAVLHTDTGEALVYEFDDIEDGDLPALYNDREIIASATVLPSINGASVEDSLLSVKSIIMDVGGWLVIYEADAEGEIGDSLVQIPLNSGLNVLKNYLLPAYDAEELLLRLHYDFAPPGIFANGEDDPPVAFEGDFVVVHVRP